MVRRRERFQNGRSVWRASGFQGGQWGLLDRWYERGGTGPRNVRATEVRGAKGRRGAGAEKVIRCREQKAKE